MDAREIVDTIFALEKFYKPEVFAVEKGQIEKAIGPFLNEEMPKRNIWPQILPLSPSVDKWNRARSIQGRMRARAVRFDKDADWYQTFEDELTRFPRDKHDDQVDAFAYLGLILDRMVEAPTEQEIADDIYYDAYEQSGLLEVGRSSTTGY
jgi:predicted phage terminase large subunit-like protein